jgi:hypothetical protein
MPYPLTATVSDKIQDSPLRTKVCGVNCATIGSCLKLCHGNEPGTLKEVVSLNTTGPCPILTGAFTVLIELGPAGFTGSLCDMNKAIMPGIGSNASDASGTGGGGGAGGGSPGAGGAPEGPQGPSDGSGDGGGDATGQSLNPSPGPGYCPDASKTAPPGMQEDIDKHDLRQVGQPYLADANSKAAYDAAVFGAPGGAGPNGQTQAFWSGAGKDTAVAQGRAIQEGGGGAQTLDQMGKANQLPAWDKENAGVTSTTAPDGSQVPVSYDPNYKGPITNITGENLWKTVSRRSAENATGSVDAYVVGMSGPNNVFSSTELPTLLHNKNDLRQIVFRDAKTGDPVGSWIRHDPSVDCPSGKWTGPDIPASNGKPPFALSETKGFTR